MFGKQLLYELKQYMRRLWPYAIAVVVMSALACVIMVFDRNEVEATGPMVAIGFFIIVAFAFLVRGVTIAYISFSKSLALKLEKAGDLQSVNQWLWAKICAFLIFIFATALLLLSCVCAFAWKSVGQMFLSLRTEWPYFIEFLLYTLIVSVTLYIIPIACIVASRFDKHKNIAVSVGIIILFVSTVTLVFEIQLLMHEPSTNMTGVWASVITSLVISIIVDIVMYLLTYRTLKAAFENKQNNDNN